nr:protein eva-1 homolog C isoform X2 [Misgurnus anguillicaudatus]
MITSRCRTSGLCVHILYSLLLLCIKKMDGLSDFSNYLYRILNSHSEQACDGDLLLLRCPRHSTITVQSAFYGQTEALPGIVPGITCQWRNHSCSATTALQKVIHECQGHRDCQMLVNHQVFGQDPCPGTPKYLHVLYRCKPTEHKKKVACEGDRLLLHCKYPKLLNIYSVVYGRLMEEEESCPSKIGEPPTPFECRFHGAMDVVTNLCYGKQRCWFTIDEKHFKDPCPPGTKKYLTVLYACVPQSLLKEADPNSFQTTSVTNQSTKEVEHPVVRTSKFPENRIIVSNSLMAYGYITEHPEMAGLLFTSSVCVGLLIILIAVSTHITCSRHFNKPRMLGKKRRAAKLEEEEPMNQDIDDEEENGSESSTDSSTLTEIGRKLYCWEDVTYTTEAAELMERIERRELVIQEIRMNAYLNGNTCILHSYLPSIKQNVQ